METNKNIQKGNKRKCSLNKSSGLYECTKNRSPDFAGEKNIDIQKFAKRTLREKKKKILDKFTCNGGENFGEEKPHHCLACGKSFRQRSKLRLHIETVHEGKKPYACSACDYKSGDKGKYFSEAIIYSRYSIFF